MPKILPQPPATDSNLAVEARDEAVKLVVDNLDLTNNHQNLDSKLEPENLYEKVFRKLAPWSPRYRK